MEPKPKPKMKLKLKLKISNVPTRSHHTTPLFPCGLGFDLRKPPARRVLAARALPRELLPDGVVARRGAAVAVDALVAGAPVGVVVHGHRPPHAVRWGRELGGVAMVRKVRSAEDHHAAKDRRDPLHATSWGLLISCMHAFIHSFISNQIKTMCDHIR